MWRIEKLNFLCVDKPQIQSSVISFYPLHPSHTHQNISERRNMQPGNPSNNPFPFLNIVFFFVGEINMMIKRFKDKIWHKHWGLIGNFPLYLDLHPSFNSAFSNFIYTFDSVFAIIFNSLFNPSPFPILQRVIWNG